jgi:hypothetical protein
MIPINNLPLKGLRDNNFIAKVDYQSVTNDASFIVIVGLFDSLKANVCLLMLLIIVKSKGKESLSSIGKILSMQ